MKLPVVTNVVIALAMAWVLGAVAPAVAAETGAHGHEGATLQALKLDAGRKWATDAPLRKGMTDIRNAVIADKEAIRAGKLGETRYDVLAKKIDDSVAYIVKNCKLPPEADANLHLIIAEIMQASDAIKGRDRQVSRRAGVEKVIAALEAYDKYFDHPGWQPLK